MHYLLPFIIKNVVFTTEIQGRYGALIILLLSRSAFIVALNFLLLRLFVIGTLVGAKIFDDFILPHCSVWLFRLIELGSRGKKNFFKSPEFPKVPPQFSQ